EDLERNEPEFHATVDDLLNLAGRAPFTTDEALWMKKLGRARLDLQAAIESSNEDQLKGAAYRINDVLSREPSRINFRLATTARALRLGALVEALTVVRNRLAALDREALGPRHFAAFEQGVAALAQLDDLLDTFVSNHNAFQEIDDELRRVEA